MKSKFVAKVDSILNIDQTPYIDKRKKGYRLKFIYLQATKKQMKQIEALPHVIKVKNIISIGDQGNEYEALCIWVDIRPSYIWDLKRAKYFVKKRTK